MPNHQPDYPPDLLRGSTDVLLLSLIDRLGSTYGYQIIKEIEKRSQGFFRFKEGTIYPALRKLENEGLLRGEWREMPNGQARRYYRLTQKGRGMLSKKMLIWQNFITAANLIFQPSEA
jgi:DNA-binding PadR family transcriptional regulator